VQSACTFHAVHFELAVAAEVGQVSEHDPLAGEIDGGADVVRDRATVSVENCAEAAR